MKRILKISLGIAVLAFVIWILSLQMTWQEVVDRLEKLDLAMLAALALLIVMTRLPQAESLRRALPQDVDTPGFLDCFWNISLKALFNQVLVGAGVIAQGARLKYSHRVKPEAFLRATWAQWMAQMVAVGSLGLLASVFFTPQSPVISIGATAIFAVLIGMALMLLHPRSWIKHLPLNGRIRAFVDAHAYGRQPILALVALQLLVALFRFMRVVLILALISPGMDPLVSFYAFMLGEIVLVFPVTPGGIGIRELLLGAGAIGVASQQLILAGLVDRAMALLVTLGLGSIALFTGRQKPEPPGHND